MPFQPSADLIDLGIVIIVALSALIGLVRGLMREAVSLATWVAAFALAFFYVKPLAEQIPFTLTSEVARLGVSFAIIFFGVLIIGALINYLLSAAVASIGLGGVDRVFGGIFGALRGALVVVLVVVLAGVTTLPKQDWWKESRLLPWFEQGADKLKSSIPEDLSNFLDRSGLGVGESIPEAESAPVPEDPEPSPVQPPETE